MSGPDITCPTCGAELDLAVLFAHADDQRALSRLIALSVPLGARVLQYMGLFQPPRQRLTAAKKIKLLLQLLPDLERQAVSFKGREWHAPLAAWAQAIDQMLAARDAGRLELPMKGHGYLYAILTGLADRLEASAEAQAEAARRQAPARATVQVAGRPLPIGDALEQVYGGRDPELLKAERSARDAAPMPAAARQLLAALKTPHAGKDAP